jgi:hypothetical protein
VTWGFSFSLCPAVPLVRPVRLPEGQGSARGARGEREGSVSGQAEDNGLFPGSARCARQKPAVAAAAAARRLPRTAPVDRRGLRRASGQSREGPGRGCRSGAPVGARRPDGCRPSPRRRSVRTRTAGPTGCAPHPAAGRSPHPSGSGCPGCARRCARPAAAPRPRRRTPGHPAVPGDPVDQGRLRAFDAHHTVHEPGKALELRPLVVGRPNRDVDVDGVLDRAHG